MKQFKGTPGEWNAGEYYAHSGACNISVGGFSLAWVGHGNVYPHPNFIKDICESNAKLMAAAPDLLEELQLTLGALREICFTCGAARPESTIRRAEAAIAKALGETK